MAREWTIDGPVYEIDWGGERWALSLESSTPGLRFPPFGPLLALEGVSEPARGERGIFSDAALLGHECRFNRVEATFAPRDWSELFVRAAWSPWEEAGMDLEVQVHALTVDRLRALEVTILSAFAPLPEQGSLRSVEPRDRFSAAMSYDGREDDLNGLVSGPVGLITTPWLAPKSGREGWTYVEMARPQDLSRRIHEGRLPFVATRYGLFGHDLEKGVVLRARLRALWLPKSIAFTEAERAFTDFLNEPPPLTT